MIKGLLLFTAGCLLLTGCSAAPGQPAPQERPLADMERQAQAAETRAEALRAKAPSAQPLPTARSVPAPTLAPAQTSSAPAVSPPAAARPSAPAVSPPAAARPSAPSAKATPAAPRPETGKKPSVPVHQNQRQAGTAQRKLSLSELARKYPQTFKIRGPAGGNKIALTFDDGPDTRFTPKVLDVLKAHQVKATFFLIGSQASAHPETVRRIVKEGHVIGNHSYSHANLPKLAADKFAQQIEQTDKVLEGLIGYSPKLLRPPYGAVNEEQVQWAAEHKYLIVNWNVDSLDWKSLKADAVLNNIIRQTKPGSIILQHSGGADSQDLSGTIQALAPMIRQLKASGYSFVTVPELLQVPFQK